jgi:hypothetical protein
MIAVSLVHCGVNTVAGIFLPCSSADFSSEESEEKSAELLEELLAYLRRDSLVRMFHIFVLLIVFRVSVFRVSVIH